MPPSFDLNTYQIAGLEVQSYFDERTTWELYNFARDHKLLGRNAPPGKGFLGMVNRLIWEKRFTMNDRRYVVIGGGGRIAFFEDVLTEKEEENGVHYGACAICETTCPAGELIASAKGLLCAPCYEVWFPRCEKCGERMQVPDDADPDDLDSLCDQCRPE